MRKNLSRTYTLYGYDSQLGVRGFASDIAEFFILPFKHNECLLENAVK